MVHVKRQAPRVLALSGEAPLLKLLQRILKQDGLEVVGRPAADWRSAAGASQVAVVIDLAAFSMQTVIDIMETFPHTALLILYDQLHPHEVNSLIDLGAEVLMRPFRETDLLFRLRAARLRAVEAQDQFDRVCLGDLLLDPLRGTVSFLDREFALSPADEVVLLHLLGCSGTVPFSKLLAALRHPNTPIDRQYVRTVVCRLRRRLQPEGFEILNDRSLGYRLAKSDADPQSNPREDETQ